MIKICSRCGLAKEKTEFHTNSRRADKKEPFCKECRSLSNRKSYEKNLFTFIVRLKRYQSKKLGVPFDLTVEYLKSIWRNSCSCCNRPLTRDTKSRDTQYSLDRLNPMLGYTKGNIALLCQRCNRIKYDATADELESVAKWMRLFERSTTISKESTRKCVEAPSPLKSGDDIVCS